MLSSRNIDDLATPAKNRALKFLAAAKAAGIDVLVTCTLRDEHAQNALYARGRSRTVLTAAGLKGIQPAQGPIVTNAKGGESYHQYACAFDVVPLRNGKLVWGTEGMDGDLWEELGQIGEACGLEWAGRWKGKMREMAHFQYRAGLLLADFRAGKQLPADAPEALA
jgi:peptidoglycan L-alanyl-D-glutamate endopeptidase CwlK